MWYNPSTSSGSSVSGGVFVDRGEAATPDYDKTDLTFDDTYHDLDISSIIGVGQRFVLIQGYFTCDANGKIFRVRQKGSSGYNYDVYYVEVANVTDYHSFWVVTDESGVISYSGAIATWNKAQLTIRGWFEL